MPRLKIIVRNLPADITYEQFREFIAPWDAYINYVSFHPGKTPSRYQTKDQAIDVAILVVDYYREEHLVLPRPF